MYDKFESIAYTNSQAVVVSSACTSGSKKRPLPFRGFGGPTVTTPTAEGGGEEVSRPPSLSYYGVLTRRTEGRRILPKKSPCGTTFWLKIYNYIRFLKHFL